MRRRRTLVVLGGLLALAGLTGAVFLLWLPPKEPEVSLTTLAHLKPGMSEADVAAVLGPPTADRTSQPPAGDALTVAGGRLLEYAGERATATVEFDASGRLVRCRPVEVRKVTGLERIRLRLNWW